MMQSNDLKHAGLKATLPRLRILEVFEEANQRHLSPEDVYRHLLNNNVGVGLATVYRVLTQLASGPAQARSFPCRQGAL